MHPLIINTAKQAALKSRFRFRLGAVIFDKSRIFGIGYNDPYKTHPKSNTPYKTIHAEFMAALDCGHSCDIYGSSIYVHRLLANDRPGLAKPCMHCCAMLKGYGIKNVFFSDIGGRVCLL